MKKVTLKEVAKKAGVSIATVSYVINNKNQKISEETRKKVMDAVEELGFVPDNAAKTLKLQQASSVGVVIMKNMGRNLVYRKYVRMLITMEDCLKKYGYQMTICSGECDTSNFPDFVRYFLERRICGVIYISDACQDIPEEHMEFLKKYGIPFVAVDTGKSYDKGCSLNIDYYQSARECMTYLCDHHDVHRILFLRSGDDYMKEKEDAQTDAVTEVAREHQISVVQFGIEGIGLCDKMEIVHNKNERFSKWRNILFQINQVIDYWNGQDIFLCSESFLAECVYFTCIRKNLNPFMVVFEEFHSTPMVWIDIVGNRGNVLVNNLRPDLIAEAAVDMLKNYISNGEKTNRLLCGKNVEFLDSFFR